MADIGVALATSLPPTILGLVVLLQSKRNEKAVNDRADQLDTTVAAVHNEVKTENGLTIGNLADRDEAHRIIANTLPEDRTASEQAYVAALVAVGRNTGHEGEAPGPTVPDEVLGQKPAPASTAKPLDTSA